jgi:pimeloyl-ACP methyl ester carboxylesterase
MRLAERETVVGESGLQWRWDPLLRTRAGLGFSSESMNSARYLELLRSIQASLTIVLGGESTIRRDDGAFVRDNLLPGARTIVLAGGHNVYLEQPRALAEIISESVHLRSK